jgi:hypothetical protein
MFRIRIWLGSYATILGVIIALVAVLSSARPLAAASLQALPNDGIGLGFVRAEVDKRGRALVFGAPTGAPTGDNSIRSFDGTKWETLWPSGPGNGGVHQRHNGTVLYVPSRDELWITGGSHLETLPGALRSGRFNVGSKKWLATSPTDSGAFDGIIKGGFGFTSNQAAAWSEELDLGVLFGGSGNGVYDHQWLIEKNLDGPEPYKLTAYQQPRPAPRSQAQNLLVSAGSDFYLVGGYAGSVDNKWILLDDFWKFDGRERKWSQLSNVPAKGYQAAVTYDSAEQKIVAWINDKLFTYHLSKREWADETPTGLPCLGNHIGVYLPKAQLHFFEGGNLCSNGASNPGAFGIRLR